MRFSFTYFSGCDQCEYQAIQSDMTKHKKSKHTGLEPV